MKYSEIFLKAAEDVAERETYTCNAVEFVCLREMIYPDFEPRTWYQETICLNGLYGFSLGELDTAEDSQSRRVIMLCLAAAIAELEGL